MKRIVFSLCTAIFLLFLFHGCAKIGTPTGGPKDTTPPKYVEGEPENYSTRFTGKEITFRFDEYIQLDNVNQELLISPPLKSRPEVRLREKSIRVRLKDDLLPNTTYTLNFGNSIFDLNEKNPLPDFEFVFSTGDKLDSLSVAGKTVGAFDHKALKDQEITVMLYENLADSAPYKEIPRYVGRASEDGLFMINNIHADTFRVISLNDANGNLKYDPGTEEIAFLDSLLVINPQTVRPTHFIRDTIKISRDLKAPKSTKKNPVKALMDTSLLQQGKNLDAVNIDLYYFMEGTDQVFLTDRKRDSPEKLFFVFSRPLHDSLLIRPLNYVPSGRWYLKEPSMEGDSLTYWITDTTMAKKDTLMMSLSYITVDSAGRFITRTDSIRMRRPQAVEKGGGRKNKSQPKALPKTMVLSSSLANQSKQDLNGQVIFTLDRPISALIPENIEFYRMEDTVRVEQKFTVSADPWSARKFIIHTTWQENANYRLLLKPGTVEDIYGLNNDSLNLKFVTQRMEYYGRILLTVQEGKYPMIIQVMDEKDRVVKAGMLGEPGKVVFDFLPPQKYTLKVIFDKNGNGRWDTGDYLRKIQPEKIHYYKLPVQLRSNWDQEVTWIIPDN